MNTTNQDSFKEDLRQMAQEIVAAGRELKERIGALVVEVIEKHQLELDQLSGVVEEIVNGAGAALEKLAPEERAKRLSETFAGLEAAFTAVLNATTDALKKHHRYADEELTKLTKHLEGLEDTLAQSISALGEQTESEMNSCLNELQEHAEKFLKHIRPPLEAALQAAKETPSVLAKEATAAAMTALADVLQSVNGLFGTKK